jgi:oligopeptide transport system permease protein
VGVLYLKLSKKVGMKLLINLFMLLVILLVIIGLTQFPRHFNMEYVDGKTVSNITFDNVKENIVNYAKSLSNGNALSLINPKTQLTVKQTLKEAYTKSMSLFFSATLLALIIGIPKGIFDSRRKKEKSTFKLLFTLVPLSLPDILSIALVQFIAYKLYAKQFTYFGLGAILYVGHGNWTQAIYPSLALALVPAAYIARLTASSIENVYSKEYILAAQGKGCSEARIIRVHTMKNVFAEILSGFPTIVSVIFSSLVIVERVFYYPGVTFQMLGFYHGNFMSGFTTFALTLGITYYIIFSLSNVLKQIILPQLKED